MQWSGQMFECALGIHMMSRRYMEGVLTIETPHLICFIYTFMHA